MSNITMTPELEKAIAAAGSAADITSLIQAETLRQAGEVDAKAAADKAAADKATADKVAADKVAADAAAAATPKTFSKTENINGRDFEFVANSQAELDTMLLNAYRVAQGLESTSSTPVETSAEVAAREAHEREAAEAKAAQVAELQLKMQRGEISMKDYIEQSGAIDEYLASRGVSVESLQKSVESTENKETEKQWSDAADAFRNNSDWPGGEKNMQLLGMEIVQMGLLDATDKVAALNQAYQSLRSRDMLFPVDATTTTSAAAPAAAIPPAREAAPQTFTAADVKKLVDDAVKKATAGLTPPEKVESRSSSIFGSSYGATTGGAAGTAEAAAKKEIEIPATATPQEIIEAFKQGSLASGKDPNAAFTEAFRAKK